MLFVFHYRPSFYNFFIFTIKVALQRGLNTLRFPPSKKLSCCCTIYLLIHSNKSDLDVNQMTYFYQFLFIKIHLLNSISIVQFFQILVLSNISYFVFRSSSRACQLASWPERPAPQINNVLIENGILIYCRWLTITQDYWNNAVERKTRHRKNHQNQKGGGREKKIDLAN